MSTRVRVIYKSGADQIIKCDSFKVTMLGGAISKLTWENAKPRPLFIGVDDVAAVYDLHPKRGRA